MRLHDVSVVAAGAALLVCAAGCASAAAPSAQRAAQDFYAAVQGRQVERACALLAPEAAESLRTGDQRCETSLGGLDLPGGQVRDVEVWGDEARVRLSGDTVFLHRFPQGWRVRGAGCASRGVLPYDCEVST
ncbi:hypothetical protein AB0G15_04485 [Streptosporangium sp. NPDC023825]|uniref:hypothetical protein n=1 Tax=Streptosporangium sp. NPDC023825 TaxID=3154909 RepID=UPI003440F372